MSALFHNLIKKAVVELLAMAGNICEFMEILGIRKLLFHRNTEYIGRGIKTTGVSCRFMALPVLVFSIFIDYLC